MSEATPPILPEEELHALARPGAAPQPASIDIGPAAFTGRDGNRFTFTGVVSRARVRLTILAPDLARVDLLPEGHQEPPRSWAVAQPEDAWPEVALEVKETREGDLIIHTAAMTIRVALAPEPFRAQFFNSTGALLSEDAPDALSIVRQDPGPTPYIVQRGAWGARCAKSLMPGEHFFGFGERTGPMDKRGSRFLLWNIDPPGPHSDKTWAMYCAIPFFLSVREAGQLLAYGIFLDSPALTEFDLGATRPDRLIFGVGAGEGALTYYFFAGDGEEAVQTILARYTQLTGRMSLPPRWALGYHQCRWSYFPDSWVRKLAREFRARQMPCDALWLDIDYMDGYRDFTWHPQRFPDPQGLIAELHEQGFHVVTILDPGVKQDPTYHVYQQGVREGYFCAMPDGQVFHGPVWPGMAAFPDFSRAEVRQWWGDLHAALLDVGVDGIWDDMNEPTLSGRFDPELAVPDGSTLAPQVLHGAEGEALAHPAFHNAYGSMMSRATREGLERLRPDQRPFVLTRSAYAGVQRYAAVWTGDNSSTWEHLRLAVPMCLNIGLSGLAFVGVDVGGFWGSSEAELVTRWTQLGALLPFCRNHSSARTNPQEPWAFGEPYESINRRYLELRYRLLPYLTTLFHEAATTGAPIMRPLFWHHLSDQTTWGIDDQFLLGRDLLAAPIYQPGANNRRLYLPAGEWASFWSGERFHGPAWVEVRAPLDELALFVRAGGFLPLGPVMQHTAERPTDPLTLLLAVPAADGTGVSTLYEDDGLTNHYRDGAFSLTSYRYTWQAPNKLSLTLEKPDGSYQAGRRHLQVEAHLPFPASQPQPRAQSVLLNGAPLAEGADGHGWKQRATRSEVIVTLALNETWEKRAVELLLS
jgi:alpha-glucosidase